MDQFKKRRVNQAQMGIPLSLRVVIAGDSKSDHMSAFPSNVRNLRTAITTSHSVQADRSRHTCAVQCQLRGDTGLAIVQRVDAGLLRQETQEFLIVSKLITVGSLSPCVCVCACMSVCKLAVLLNRNQSNLCQCGVRVSVCPRARSRVCV